MAKKYVPAGVFLTCDKGTLPAPLKVTFNARTSINGMNLATDLDKLPVVNVPPLGVCTMTKLPCVLQPIPGMGWKPVKDDVQLGMGHPLLEDSQLRCAATGCISIHFSMAAAQAACAPPPAPEKSLADQADDYLKTLGSPLGDYGRFQLGVAEGLWAGGKGLAEGLWGMAKGGWNAVTHPADTARAVQEGVGNAYKWAGDSQNWANAASSAGQGISSAADWASHGENWQAVGDQLQNMSPRDWGNVTGQVAFEIGLTAATAGAGTALNAAAKTSRVARMAVRVARVADLEGHALSLAVRAARSAAGRLKVLGKVVTGARRGRRVAARARHARAALRRSALGRKTKAVGAWIERKRKCLWDPIDVTNGVMLFDQLDLALAGPLPLVWNRWWYSNSDYAGPLGTGWHHSYDALLLGNETDVALRLCDGRLARFPQPPAIDERQFNRAERLELWRDAAGAYHLYSLDERRTYTFVAAEPATKPTADAAAADRAYRLHQVADANGLATRLAYDEAGLLRTLTDCAGRQLRLHYDAQQRITALEAPEPDGTDYAVVMRYAYDAAGHLLAATDALGQALSYVYRADHLMARKTFRTGVSFYFEYEGHGPTARCVRTWGDGQVLNGTLELREGHTTARSAAPGDVSEYYHENGLVTRHVNPLGAAWYYSYNRHGELVLARDPLDQATGYDYDARGNQTQVTYPDGTKVQTAYNALDLPEQVTDANGGQWHYTYDEAGNLLMRTDPLGVATTYGYDEHGQLTSVTDAAGLTTRLLYNAQHQLRQLTDPAGHRSHYAYDARGQLLSLIDARGQVRQRRYDALGRLVAVHEADGQQRQFSYDGENNLLRVQDAQHHVEFTYSALDQVATRTEHGARVAFAYDAAGRLTHLRNEHEETYTFERDAAGQVVTEIGFDGLTRHYERDLAGRVGRVRRPGGQHTDYGYDAAGRLTRVHFSDGQQHRFAYRPDGQLLEAHTPTHAVLLRKDARGRVLAEQQGPHEVSRHYDAQGELLELRSSLGAAVVATRGPGGQLTHLRAAGGWQASFRHDAFGQEIERQLGGVQLSWQHDGQGQLVSQRVLAGAGGRTLVRQRAYRWRAGGQQLSEVDDSLTGLTQYGYDAWGNLAEARYADGSQELRAPDAVGNLFRTEARTDRRYGKGGQLKEANGTRYQYDAEGNLIRKTLPTGQQWHYGWDGAGQLASVQRPDGYTVTFAYDALGRRISKRFRGKVTHWVWDGDKPLHEWHELEVGPGAGSVQELTTWLFEEDSFAPLAKLMAQGVQSVVCDHLGTPLELYDERGQKTWQAQLDSYGAVREGKGKPQDCPFRYQGQYEDTETGLYYNRFRYYDPQAGQYISQDPIRLAGNNPTLYGYVKDPNCWTDIYGWACTHHASNPQQAHAAIKDKWGHEMAPADMRELHNTVDRIKTRNPRYNEDGTVFKNSHTISPDSQRLNTIGGYEEWTVKTPGVSNRGSRRVVVNRKAGKAYYTHDHYDSFMEIDLSGWH